MVLSRIAIRESHNVRKGRTLHATRFTLHVKIPWSRINLPLRSGTQTDADWTQTDAENVRVGRREVRIGLRWIQVSRQD